MVAIQTQDLQIKIKQSLDSRSNTKILELDMTKSSLKMDDLYSELLELIQDGKAQNFNVHAKMRFSQAVAFSQHHPPIILCGHTFNDFKFDKITYITGE